MIEQQTLTIPANSVIDVLDEMGIPVGNFHIYIHSGGSNLIPTVVNDLFATTDGYPMGLANNRGTDTFNLPLHGDTLFLRAGGQPITIKVLLVSAPPLPSGPVSVTFNY